MASVRLPVRYHGLVDFHATVESIVVALANAHADHIHLEVETSGGQDVLFNGLRVAHFIIKIEGGFASIELKPTASMILLMNWLLVQLPSTASVTWQDGWPTLRCPPNDDREYEDDPTPLVPNELVPA